MHHHYCRLAVITLPDIVDRLPHLLAAILRRRRGELRLHDLRHRRINTTRARLTIQQAVNQLLQTGGTVCLGPGIFNLGSNRCN